MTGSDVFFDPWAWWEVLHDTPAGRRLGKTHGGRIRSIVLSLSEPSSKLGRMNRSERIPLVLEHVASESEAHSVTADDARLAGSLHAQLRATDENVGLVDALLLASARQRHLASISAAQAFGGLKGVRPR